MNESVVRFEQLNRSQLRTLAPVATVIIPLGSTEQHGPHLPVGTDSMIVTDVAERAAAIASETIPVVVLPTQRFGFAHHHLSFGGTVSIDQQNYSQVLTSIGQSLATDGFTRIVFINGHGGNVNSMQQAIDRLAYECDLNVQVGGTSYWTCAADVLSGLETGPTPGHAGSFETSCMLALHPQLVALDAIPSPEAELQPLSEIDLPGGIVRTPGIWQDSDGRTDDSTAASAQLGRQALDLITQELAKYVIEFHHRATGTPVAPAAPGRSSDTTADPFLTH